MTFQVRITLNNEQKFIKKFTGQLAEKKAYAYALDVAISGYKRTSKFKGYNRPSETSENTLLYIYPPHRIYSIIVEKIDG